MIYLFRRDFPPEICVSVPACGESLDVLVIDDAADLTGEVHCNIVLRAGALLQ